MILKAFGLKNITLNYFFFFVNFLFLFLFFIGGPAGFDMKILWHVIFLLTLGGVYCQNNRNAKPSGRAPKKPSSPSAEISLEDDSTLSSGKETRSGNQQTAAANKPTDDMKLHLLRNTLATCNDGTAAG